MRLYFVAALLSVISVSVAQEKSASRFKSMLESYYDQYLKSHPTVASSIGDYRYNDRLENNLSQPYRDEVQKLYSRYLDSLKRFDIGNLSQRDQLSYNLLKYDLNRQLQQLKNPTYLDPVNQFRRDPGHFLFSN